MKIWDYFAETFGASNLVPIALAGDGVESDLPEGVRGKVPSVYNTHGKIVGFKEWQTCRAQYKDVLRWAQDGRYGFGVILGQPLPQGGVAVCIDVDTENQEHQAAVEQILRAALDVEIIPQRVRVNSNRRAYVLCVETQDAITKRVFTLRKAVKAEGIKGEAVEILGQGQQFAAHGVHPSGADIEWLDGPADSLTADTLWPVMGQGGQRLSFEQFTAVMDAIAERLPVLTDTTKAARNRNAKGAKVKPDDVALYLDAEGWTLSVGAEGQRNIRSPFEAEYTSEQADGDTSVTYFLPGTHDYEQGHFVSLHASDASRTNADFLHAIGFVASQFESYPTDYNASSNARPSFTQIKGGKFHDRIELTLPNVLAALAAPGWLGHHIAFDDFTSAIVCGGPGKWRPFRDTDYTALRLALELKGFMPVGRDIIRDAVQMTAETQTIDTAAEWLRGLKWDGVKRIDTLFPCYFGAEDSPYARAVSAYLMTALAGRILQPGIQADMMPILIGAQGCGKSRGVQALAPNLEWFTDSMTFRDSEAEQARKLLGVVLAELAEMSGLRKRDIEDIKAMVTRTAEKWTPKYIEFAKRYNRRAMMIGTSNDGELIDDATGGRRWLPLEVGTVDIPAIRSNMPQLWAEAAARFKKTGIEHAAAVEHGIARLVHDTYRVTDVMDDDLSEWLDTADELDGTSPRGRNWVTTADAIRAMQARNVRIDLDRSGQMRAAKALKAAGFARRRRLVNNRLVWGYELA